MTGRAKVMAQRLRSLHTVRAHAAHALGFLRDQRAGAPLLVALTDADPLVRMQSAGALGRLKAPGAVTGLIGALADSDPRVRTVAAGALGAFCEPEAGPALQRAINDQDGGVRERVSTALGRLGYEAARTDLVRLAEEDPIPRVRDNAREALRRLDSGTVCR
jgi:HEAT repeat protein